ncbi:MAG: hypothetical protein V3W14_05720 [Candidatus Neomarinimicrobiota bacterium]
MQYFSLLIFLHVFSIALFTGSWTAVLVLWKRTDWTNPDQAAATSGGMVSVGRFASAIAGSLAVLAGLVMILVQPQIMAVGGLFHTKIFLGAMAVGLSHLVTSRLKRLQNTMNSGGSLEPKDRITQRLAMVVLALAVTTIFLGVRITHG